MEITGGDIHKKGILLDDCHDRINLKMLQSIHFHFASRELQGVNVPLPVPVPGQMAKCYMSHLLTARDSTLRCDFTGLYCT
jgi:hypothetical protein